MIDWRYLTTVPEFVPFHAAKFRNELWLAGSWGEADKIAGRSTYAPVVKVGREGDLHAMRQWPDTAASTGSINYASVHAYYQAAALSVWQDKLFVGSMRRDTVLTSTTAQREDYGLSSFDGDVWLDWENHQYTDLLPLGDRLLGITGGAIRAFDGFASEEVAQYEGVAHVHLGPWDSRLGVVGPRIEAPLSLDLIQYMWEARVWQAHRLPLPWGSSDFVHAMSATRPWVYWRGKVWAVLPGTNSYLAVWDGGWRPVIALTGWRAPNLVVVRNRLLIYQTIEVNTWSYPQTVEVSLRGKIAEYDGREVQTYDIEGLSPYLVIPLDDGDAVAFCRSEQRTAFLENNTDIGRQYDATDQWKLLSYPDAEAMIYVIEPGTTRPPIVPFGSLSGTVDDGADPIEGATVQADVLSDETDALGDYAINDMPVGRYTAVAAKDGYQADSARVSIEDQQTTDQDFTLSTLTPGQGMVYGRVLDAQTRRPLYGVTVSIGSLSETTAADGTYSRQVDPDEYEVAATLPGYIDAEAVAVAVEAGDTICVDFMLIADDSGAGTVYGWVTDLSDGSVVEGAVVAVGAYETITDEDGYYSRAGIPAGAYEVTVSCSGYDDTAGGLTVPTAGTIRADWGLIPSLTATGTLEVTVLDGDGVAVEGAAVTVEGAGVLVTGVTGIVEFTLPAGTYIVHAEMDGYKPDGGPATVTAGNTTQLELTLTAITTSDTRGWLWGIVRDVADGAPLAADVDVAGEAHLDNDVDTTADAAGFYLVEDLWPGIETVVASMAGYHDQTAENVPIGARRGTRLDFALLDTGTSLDGTGTIAGYVFDAVDHSRIGQARVTVDRLRMVYADELGEYEFDQLAEAVHQLDAEAKGFEPTHVVNVPVSAQETTYCDIPLHRRVRVGRLVVVVLDESNEWVEGVTVLAGPFLSRTTDDEGTADFAQIPEGWYSVLAYKNGYVPAQAEVSVPADGTAILRLTLTAQGVGVTDGYLVGYVYDLWSLRGLQYAGVAANGSSTTAGARGYYSLAISAGTYDVTGSLEDYRSRTLEGVVAANEITRLDIPLLPDVGDEPAQLFVGVPDSESIPEGGPASVLLDYPEDAEWQLGVDTNGGTSWRRCQRVNRGIETLVDTPGEDVRILAKKVSGKITPPAASLRP